MQEHDKRLGKLAMRIFGIALVAILLFCAAERVFDIETSIARYSRMIESLQVPRSNDEQKIDERIAALTAALSSSPRVRAGQSTMSLSDIGIKVRTLADARGMILLGFRTLTSRGERILEYEATGSSQAVLGFLSDFSHFPDGLSIRSVQLVSSTSGSLDAVIGITYEAK